MRLKIVLAFISLLFLSLAIPVALFTVPVAGAPETIEVHPGESIQAAINVAGVGYTVLVHAGTYNESLTISKYLKLIGEDKSTTIVDANGTNKPVIYIAADNVHVSGFTIQNDRHHDGIYLYRTYADVIEDNIFKYNYAGIYIYYSTQNRIVNNLMIDNQHGVRLWLSDRNIVANNTITLTLFWGINPYYNSYNNSIYGNIISNNGYGIYIGDDSGPNNVIYHNNFIENTVQGRGNQANDWDNGAEGNFWSDYNGTDTDGDGIGDTFVPHLGLDPYPLVELWSPVRVFNAGTWGNVTYNVTILSDHSVASFNFSYADKSISFNVTGPPGAEGFCDVAIPRTLLWVQPGEVWVILVDDVERSYTIWENTTHTVIRVLVTFGNPTHTVTIIGTHVVPEFPTFLLLPPLLIILSLVSALLRKKCITKRRNIFR